MRKFLQRPEAIPALLLPIAFGIGILLSPFFLDLRYLLDSTSLYAETGLLVLGMTFIIITGNIDLSVASSMALVACTVAKLTDSGMPIPAAMIIGLAVGGLLGAFNGLLVAYAKLPSFLVTLGTLALYRGIAQAWMGAASVPLPASFVGLEKLDFPLLGVPMPMGIVLMIALILGLVLHRTITGRWIFAVGINENAAYFAAVPTQAVKFWVFVNAGFLAAVAGLLIDSRLGVARYDVAPGLELDAITATVLGGTSIYGGRGSVLGSMLALFLIAIIRVQMGLANISAEVQMTVVGTLLIVAVAITMLTSRLGGNSRRVVAGVKASSGE
ncbi:MAG: ABC transporter permease [Fimbriimonadaceae bacterium]|nr:ABC transporter permease [Fimbriimonadaceae bacterium]